MLAGRAATANGMMQPGVIRREAREMLALTGPLVLTQIGQIAIMTTDVVMIGWLGEQFLAASSVGSTIFFSSFVLVMGIVMATAPLASQAFGARRPRRVRRVIRQGLWITILLSFPAVWLMAYGEEILLFFGQTPGLAARAQPYLDTIRWSLPTACAFIVLRGFVASINRPNWALWVMLAGIPLNGLLNYALIFGELGAPRLELYGAGLASSIANAAMIAAMLAVVVWRRPFRKYNILGRFWRPDWTVFFRIFLLGLPIAVMYLMEFGVFAAAVMLMGQISETAVAAHQIALQIAAITFMVPFGISQAATVRVGHAVGRGDPIGARRAGWVAVLLGVGFMAVMSLVFVVLREPLVGAFLDPAKPGSPAVLALAAQLLLIAAAFQMADGAQSIGAGALRGLNDTAIPMVFTIFAYWVTGFGLAWVLGFEIGWGPHGIWAALAIGLAVAAVCHLTRFWWLTRHGRLPASALRPTSSI